MARIGFQALAGVLLFAMVGAGMADDERVGGYKKVSDYKGTETPAYTVEARTGAIELRAYPAHLAAEVRVRGSRDAAVGTGFRVLAAFIFGGNEAKAKVAMTTPVAQSQAGQTEAGQTEAGPTEAGQSEKIAMTTPVAQQGEGTTWTVQFSMPSEFTMDTLPRPKDPRIRLVTNPAKRMVVLEFSGIPTTPALEERSAELRSWADKQGLQVEEPPQFLFYDSPFTLPWNRRNEVGFVVK